MADHKQLAKEARIKKLFCTIVFFMLKLFYDTRSKIRFTTERLCSVFDKVPTKNKSSKVLFSFLQKQIYILEGTQKEAGMEQTMVRRKEEAKSRFLERKISENKSLSNLQAEDESFKQKGKQEVETNCDKPLRRFLRMLQRVKLGVFSDRPYQWRWNKTSKANDREVQFNIPFFKEQQVPYWLQGALS